MTTAGLALIIFVAIALQLILALTVGMWQRRHAYDKAEIPTSERSKARDADQTVAMQTHSAGWDGYKPFRVVRRVNENLAGISALSICNPVNR
jgi:FtsZ-interacting cell division protein ZipA